MLLWEALCVRLEDERAGTTTNGGGAARTRPLPFEIQCSAITKSGRRCRGKTRKGTKFCPFHDPSVSRERRRQFASQGGRNRHRLARLPDGYLRKLTSRAAVGDAMDRLYREVRLGIITPEMGTVLFNVVTRLLDSGLCDSGVTNARSSRRSKADKLRPKLEELLTRSERTAWRKAAASESGRVETRQRPAAETRQAVAQSSDSNIVKSPGKVALQLAP